MRGGKQEDRSVWGSPVDRFPENSNTTFLEDSGAGFEIGFSTAQNIA
jgi:hypothetical protein